MDVSSALHALRQVTTLLESIEDKQKRILLDREALIAEKTAFYKKSGEMTDKVERADKLITLAKKMKKEVDDEREQMKLEKRQNAKKTS